MTEAVDQTRAALRFGRSVWLWPVVGALLAAWPVWRSFFAEVPDVGAAPLRGQVAAAVGELILIGGWVARYRGRVTGFNLPLFAIGFATIVLIMASMNNDAPTADLSALAICWVAAVFLFAGAVLLDGQRAFATMQGGAVPQVSMLLPAHERIGYWLLGIALAIATIQETPQGFLLAALAAVSPGAVLVWGGLCDTARAVLARRRVYVADFSALPTIVGRRDIVLSDPGMLVASRPKVISIMPVGEAKPGEIVGTAAALLADDDSDMARGLQDFGVSHRLRVPNIKLLDAGTPALHRGQLPDQRIVEIGTIAASAIAEEERAPFADQLGRAAELHRAVLALRETAPSPRLLGLIVLARAARPGATEAVRTLRKADFTIVLANVEIDPKDQEALTGLAVERAADWPSSAIGLARPGQPPLESCAATVHFGGRARTDTEQGSGVVIARDDPRTLVDLLQFARDFRIRARMAIVAANLPGVALLAAGLGYVPASPLIVTIAALAGIALAVALPQALRLSPTMANEVDEE
ncbi:HAD family hydrolase [Dongia deserti]|uniref:hypothetical protein n=1 Tax=Dongia deserti TaxID=2268030 RepID=UPI000E65DD17|nr:hypothetical protein [Dongia deserti]